MKILFTPFTTILDEYKPVPAKKSIPDWYKNLESYVGGTKLPNGKGETNATIKRCMPVFDVMTAGYVIPLYTDIFVSQREDDITKIKYPYYEWPNYDTISFHDIIQAPTHPDSNGFPYPKLLNPWGIKTPKGYSILITPPTHRESPFSIFPAIVDTDNYNAPINFPFVLKDPSFEGLIPAGTPIAQIIPFKRDSWNMDFGNQEDYNKLEKDYLRVKSHLWDTYKRLYRVNKEFN